MESQGQDSATPARTVYTWAIVAFRGQFCRLKQGGRADAPNNPQLKSVNPGSSDWGSQGLAPEVVLV